MKGKSMQFAKASAEIYVPDGLPVDQAISRTSHLAIAAHPDDIEILAYDGIVKCFHSPGKGFMGVILTDGAGTYREYDYAGYSDEEMVWTRKLEQKKAAMVGEYCAVAMLDYRSAEVKDASNLSPVKDILALVESAKPQVIYTHNLTDRHDTHVAVALRTVQALRSLPPGLHPQEFFGCEVWRDLDWMADEDKTVLTVDGHPNIAAALLGVHDTQNSGGKRIDLATLGRRQAHASYNASHAVDRASALILAMDLSPLLKNPQLDPAEFASSLIDHFHDEVMARIQRIR
jgi:LmbE family N-acetylglucosaminyl deacetylase